MTHSDSRHFLQTSGHVLRLGNRLLLFRHQRWHYVTLDAAAIRAVNFMSPTRADLLLSDWAASAVLLPFEQVSLAFARQVAQVILPEAEAYRGMLENGRCQLILGATTDTLHPSTATINSQIAYLEQMMKSGQAGPYLSFSIS
ncbi:MAG: hypothetical protein R6X34_05710 [Chloroflexota bacterium]